jgi:hypothetical protein
MPYLVFKETGVNASEEHYVYDEVLPVRGTRYADADGNLKGAGDIFREARDEFGRCTGKVYVDSSDGVQHVGYVFQQRREYESNGYGPRETYLHETWLSFLERDDDTMTERAHPISAATP